MNCTPGNWRIGDGGGYVITDPESVSAATRDSASTIEMYGGHVICESIANPADGLVICAAKDLREALMKLRDVYLTKRRGGVVDSNTEAEVLASTANALQKAEGV